MTIFFLFNNYSTWIHVFEELAPNTMTWQTKHVRMCRYALGLNRFTMSMVETIDTYLSSL